MSWEELQALLEEEQHEEYVRRCKEWIARRRARLDQREAWFTQSPSPLPQINLKRLDDLEAWRFELEIHEWELNEIIRSFEEGDDEAPVR